MSDIVSKEQQIYQQQIALLRLNSADGMTVPGEVADYNSRIEQVVDQMTQASLGKDGLDYIQLSEELDGLLTARQNLLRQLVPADATLTANYQQLDNLRSAFSSESTLINNSGTGYISFHMDGYENAMSIDSLTESQIRRVVSSPCPPPTTPPASIASWTPTASMWLSPWLPAIPSGSSWAIPMI